MGWWIADYWNNPNLGPIVVMSWVVWVIGSIVLHELAHGWAAIWCGDRTPIETGHMSWNPLVHMGYMSLVLFALVGIAWGAMPVDPSRFRGRYDDAKVSVAGPAMNLLLALVCIVLAAVWMRWQGFGAADHVYSNVFTFLRLGAGLNVALMLFNLLPVPPLDGSRIIASFVPSFDRLFRGEHAAVIALIGFVLLFRTVGTVLFGFAFDTTRSMIDGLAMGLGFQAP